MRHTYTCAFACALWCFGDRSRGRCWDTSGSTSKTTESPSNRRPAPTGSDPLPTITPLAGANPSFSAGAVLPPCRSRWVARCWLLGLGRVRRITYMTKVLFARTSLDCIVGRVFCMSEIGRTRGCQINRQLLQARGALPTRFSLLRHSHYSTPACCAFLLFPPWAHGEQRAVYLGCVILHP